jgi:CheY-like chemotaxis protein
MLGDTTAASRRDRSTRPHGRSRVLLIDDEPDVLETLAAVLETDFDVHTCGDAHDGMTRAMTEPFDVICTDYQMPGMTGVELLDRIVNADIVVGVVLITGRYETYLAETGTREGERKPLPVAVLRKPYEPQDLIDAIERADAFARVRRALRGLREGVR